MQPLCEPITDLTFSSVQTHQSMPSCHIRGGYLAVTSEALLELGDTTHTVKLIHWKTRRMLLSVSTNSDIPLRDTGVDAYTLL